VSGPPAVLVTCVGGAVVDRKLQLLAPAVPATSNPARAADCLGGVARNVAENLARLGVPVALVTAVGDDPGGQAVRAGLEAAGVAVSGVRVVPGVQTAQYVAVFDPGHELVIGMAAMDVLDEIREADLDAAWPGSGGWLVLDTNLRAGVLAHALRRARADGVRVAVDAVSAPKVVRLPADLRGISVLFCNRAEALAWLALHTRGQVAEVGGDDGTLARRLHAAGAAHVVLTRGADGALVAGEAGVTEVPSVPCDPVDVTGAGDAVVAGTLAGLLRGEDLPAAARRGMALASLTVASTESVRTDLSTRLLERALPGAGLPPPE
jgi:pseudouridine kinase